MAHFALGYTLYELGRFKEAYRHLRYYTEISPQGAWNWCWLGKAAQAVRLRRRSRHMNALWSSSRRVRRPTRANCWRRCGSDGARDQRRSLGGSELRLFRRERAV